MTWYGMALQGMGWNDKTYGMGWQCPKLTALSGAQVHKEGVWAMRHAIDPQVRDHHAQFGGVALRESRVVHVPSVLSFAWGCFCLTV